MPVTDLMADPVAGGDGDVVYGATCGGPDWYTAVGWTETGTSPDGSYYSW